MSKGNPTTKWGQLGFGRSRDTPHVSKDAQANITTIDQTTTRMVVFTQQTRGQLSKRPSTSGGPVSKQRIDRQREIRDDYFNPLTLHGKVTTFYSYPAPAFPSTPTASPKEDISSTPRKSHIPSILPLTPDSLEAEPKSSAISMEVPRSEIGMALGSPAHPPAEWQEHSGASRGISPFPDHSEASIDEWGTSTRPKESKRWKIFGGLFGGRKPASAEAFYQVQPEGSVHAMTDDNGKLVAESDKLRGRGRSVSTRKSKKDSKPELKRTGTAPLNFDFKDPDGRATPTPTITLDDTTLADEPHYMRRRGKSLMDVDIPDIRMERYSIMFGSVLGDSSVSQQSLLDRRQATLDNLKTAGDVMTIKEEEADEKGTHLKSRRATSPQMRNNASLAFSLFPNTPIRKEHSPSYPKSASPLHRSNTSPAVLSPSRSTFAPALEDSGHTISISANSGAQHSNAPVSLHISSMMRTDDKPPTLDENRVILTTSEPIAEGVYGMSTSPGTAKSAGPRLQSANSPHHVTSPAGPRLQSATSHHVRATSTSHHIRAPSEFAAKSTSSSSSTSSEVSNSTATSSLESAQSAGTTISRPLNIASPPLSSSSRGIRPSGEIPKPRSRSATRIANREAGRSRATSRATKPEDEGNSEEERDSHYTVAADVSIARQISVSRQQRQLLVPIKTSSLRRALSAENRVGLGITNVSLAHVASPLGAVASAAQAERERTASPLAENRERFPTPIRKQSYTQSMQGSERLVESTAKPSTPTLVIVGNVAEEAREQRWAVATANLKGSIAERRKIRKGLSPVAGEMKGRLASASAVRGTKDDAPGHAYRKSEDVVVESMT